MHLGIDLGTSNSAIVGHTGNQLRLFKTAEGVDLLPSAVYVDGQGRRFVGRKAYEQATINPDNVALEFKRLMGTSTPIKLAKGALVLTPEQASAEVLRTLVAQAQIEAGSEPVAGTVITIPAAFNQMQTEATLAAAETAGIAPVGLIHEPIAAAMASMSTSSNRGGQFLVYDLGGGTFDVALVQSSGGTVNVVAHEGVNMLGGKDFDAAMMQAFIAPWLEERFNLPPDYRLQPEFDRILRRIRLHVERAKIELSTRETTSLFVADDELRMRDLGGSDIYLDVELSRAELEQLIGDRIERTIELCHKIIRDNGWSSGDLDRVVLIGGPSKMPLVRQRVPDALGIPADLATDPMTAVATGAAIYAESRDWSGQVSQRKASRASTQAASDVGVRFDYPARTADDHAEIRVRADAPGAAWRVRVDGGDGWTSGDLELGERTKLTVQLPRPGEYRFRAVVSGPGVQPQVTDLVISRTFASAAGVPATHGIAVAVEEDIGGARQEVLDVLVAKGTILPDSGRGYFKAGRTIVGGTDDHIDVKLYQAPERLRDPQLGLFIGSFRIDAKDHLEPGETLRRGQAINIDWHLDDNGLLRGSIELPDLHRTLDMGGMYAPQLGHNNYAGDDGAKLAESMLDQAEGSVEEVDGVIGEASWLQLQRLKRRLAEQRQKVADSADPDVRRQATEEALVVRQEVGRLREAPQNQQSVANHDLAFVEELFETLAERMDDEAAKGRFKQLAATARRQIADGAYRDAGATTNQMRALIFSFLITQAEFIQAQFERLRDEQFIAIDRALHHKLVGVGHACIQREDWEGLKRVVSELIENRVSPPPEQASVQILAGLTKAAY